MYWAGLSAWTDCLRSWTGSVDNPSAWTVQSNLTQTKARRKKIGSEKRLHQKMRRLKAQLMGMFPGKSQTPPDSPYLPDSATNGGLPVANNYQRCLFFFSVHARPGIRDAHRRLARIPDQRLGP